MPIQVKPKHHARIETLVAQAKTNDPERTWTSALLADYVNEHYGDGIKFITRGDRGSLKKHLTRKGFVDDDAKVGTKLVSAYGVTDLADASMSDLTQPLRELIAVVRGRRRRLAELLDQSRRHHLVSAA